VATDFAWSPNGRSIAYRRRDTLYTKALDVDAPRAVVAGFELHSPAWSPDGAWIAYVSGNRQFVLGTAGLGNLAPSAIWLVRVTGGHPIPVTDSKSLNVSPIWLPQGRQLLFVSDRDGGRDIYQVRLRRSGEPAGPPTRLTTGLNAHTVSLAADGKRLAYSVYTETANVWSLPIPDREPAPISQATPVTTGKQIIETVAASPDGRWLAFDSDRSGTQHLYKMLAGGGEPEQLTSGPQDDFSPAWSPDGKEIAFHSFRGGTRDIFVMPAEGGAAEPVVATPAQERAPEWSPDGQQLAFASDQSGQYALYIASREGRQWGRPTRLTPNLAVGSGVHSAWSPDGRFIAYVDSQAALELIAPVGGKPRKLTEASDSLGPSTLQSVDWSTDSRFVYCEAYDARGGAGVWSVPLTGDVPRLLVRFDDAATDFGRGNFAVSHNRFYFPLEKRESDIWTAEVLTR
jgi:TolB protein